MKTVVESIDPVTIKLSVEVEPQRVKQAFDAAARELAKQVDIPGFRKGKAPRRLIEQRIGSGALAQQAMEDALNTYYGEALEAESITPVAQPEVDVDHFDEEHGCSFNATIEIVPSFDLPEHTGIEVAWGDWDVMDSQIDQQIEELRQRFAEVDEVERPAQVGDYVTLDLTTTFDGETVEDATVEDALYEVGSQGVTAKLDDLLVGKAADDTFTYTDTLPEEFDEHGGEEAEFTVLVKDVRAKSLPEIDDDFAATASEFDTVQELRKDLRDNALRESIQQADHALRGDLLEAFVSLVDTPLPPSLIEDEIKQRKHQVSQQAEQYGMSFEELLASDDMDEDGWAAQARENAETSIKARLVLDRLGRELGIEVTQEDVNMEIMRHAIQLQVPPEQVAQVIQSQGSLPQMLGDIVRRQVINTIYEAAVITGGPTDDVLEEIGLKQSAEAQALAEEAMATAAADVAASDTDDSTDGTSEDTSDDTSSDTSDDSSDSSDDSTEE